MRTAHAIASILGLAALCGCSDLRDELPKEIETDAVLASSSDGFFMEGCASAVYRLSDATAQRLLRQGTSFLRGVAHPRNENAGNPYSGWAESPVRGDRVFALHAVDGCGDGAGNPYAPQIEAALGAEGSYFALTRNGEGMILVAPRARLAGFFYFG